MMAPVQACNFGQCCNPSTQLNLYRVDRLNDCPPSSLCQCDLLGISASVSVREFDDGSGDTGLTIEYTANSYYQSYAGWIAPVLNIICDSGALELLPRLTLRL